MLASAALGGLAVEQVHAQVKSPVYFVGEIDVSNPDGYAKEYLPKAREIVKAHGGRLISAGGAAGRGAQVIAVDGEPPKRVVIYQYPNVEAVHAWRDDPAVLGVPSRRSSSAHRNRASRRYTRAQRRSRCSTSFQ